MIAAVSEKYGPPEVIKLKEIEKTEYNEDQVLIKTHCTSVNTLDIVYRSGMKTAFGLMRLQIGIFKPKLKILGFDIAGEIVEKGENVTEFQIGDRVFGGSASANAEFTSANPKNLCKMSTGMSYQEAGVMPVAALSALQGLRDIGGIEAGQNILIYGASGGIGTYAIQLAKIFGATVTGVASGKNEELVMSLGADHFIDYTKDDYASDSDNYDMIFDAVGKIPFSSWKTGIRKDGIFVTAASPYMSMTRFALSIMGNRFRDLTFSSFLTEYIPEDLEYLATLVEKGKLRSVIDQTYPLEDIVEAHRYYEQGHTAGKILVVISEE